ncbi:hypothetical protein [Polaribacter porphyrae]|uniref:Uncharacterized protein n=1 Tax=Polaribacter porphyrae TaxID=1137780 RepID=A0A2S7WME7_9FLAO|nr:hypothetical protein [Polaribacter porphyrae]PQJ78759.1 hypothetical protein BTO18_05975 [Polaribacter porphyrae]
MNLIEFVEYLKKPSEIEGVIIESNPDLDIDYADIYLENELNIYSEMYFLNAEEISGGLEILYEKKRLINLFLLFHLQEMFEEFNLKGKNNIEIAKDILDFRIKDA